MNPLLISLCLVVGLGAVALLVNEILFGQNQRVDRRIGRMQREDGTGANGNSQLFRNLNQARPHFKVMENLRVLIEQSGVDITPERLLTITGMLGLSMALIVLPTRFGMYLAPIVGTIFGMIPISYIWFRRSRRLTLLMQQLPDAFESMSRAVQAGQSIPSAMQMVATEARQPLAREFAVTCEQHNLGLSFDASLYDLSRRIPILELKILAIALIVQRQAGGNPIEIINNMSDLIRKRSRLAHRIKALTGEGRMQAIVLTLLPLVAFFGLWIGSPEYIQSLLDRPRILFGLLAAQIVAALWIRKIVQVEF